MAGDPSALLGRLRACVAAAPCAETLTKGPALGGCSCSQARKKTYAEIAELRAKLQEASAELDDAKALKSMTKKMKKMDDVRPAPSPWPPFAMDALPRAPPPARRRG